MLLADAADVTIVVYVIAFGLSVWLVVSLLKAIFRIATATEASVEELKEIKLLLSGMSEAPPVTMKNADPPRQTIVQRAEAAMRKPPWVK